MYFHESGLSRLSVHQETTSCLPGSQTVTMSSFKGEVCYLCATSSVTHPVGLVLLCLALEPKGFCIKP